MRLIEREREREKERTEISKMRFSTIASFSVPLLLISCASLVAHLATAQWLGPGFSPPVGPQMPGSRMVRRMEPQVASEGHDSTPNAMDIITARGFICEEYRVMSRDGAPISLYHAINPLANQCTLNRYPVLVFHGLSGDASQLLSNSDLSKPRRPIIGQVTYDEGDLSLPFMLLNNNFDVYLIDGRGTNLNNHKISSDIDLMEANRFWNYSLDEQAQFDLPTAIDFVLEQTQTEKVHYVGYSESTLFMFALLSSQLEYQAKLASFVAIAPVAYLTHLRGSLMPLLVGASLTPDQINGNYMPQPLSDTLGATVRALCSQQLLANTLCNVGMKSMSGQGTQSINPSGMFQTAFKSTSIKSLKHFYQLHTQRRFGMYDYGPAGNLKQYGQIVPPFYNLANIKLPTIILVRGGTDFLSTPEDQQILMHQLGVRPFLDIDLPQYNHVDFFVHKPALFEVNIPLVRSMLDILKAITPNGNILRDATVTPLRYRPVLVRMPSSSRRVEVRSQLLPNIIHGLSQSGEKLEKITHNPLGLLHNIKDQMSGFTWPNLGLNLAPNPIIG